MVGLMHLSYLNLDPRANLAGPRCLLLCIIPASRGGAGSGTDRLLSRGENWDQAHIRHRRRRLITR